MKKRIKNVLLIILAIVAVPICSLLLFVVAFRLLPDTTIFVYNDTESTLNVTLLLQNHDNNLFYLSETGIVQADETFKDNIGFENVRCIYVEHEGEIYDQLYDSNLIADTTGDVHEKITINVSSLLNEDTCPKDKSTFE